MIVGLIAAVSKNNVIGKNNSLPFDYPADLQHFKQTTLNSVIIMGSNTFQSMGAKPLPKRTNIVITKTNRDIPNVSCYPSIPEALSHYDHIGSRVWLIGGSRIYEEGMQYTDKIILTLTPDIIEGEYNELVKFPFINPQLFQLQDMRPMLNDERLILAEYNRR